MRIVYVQPADMVGGAERQGIVQMRGLRQLGVEVIPLIGGPELTWLRGQLEAVGIDDYVVLDAFPHLSTRRMTVGGRVVEAAGNVRAWWSARRVIDRVARERGADAIVANCVHGWVLTGGRWRGAPVPLVWRAGTRLGVPAQRVGVRLIARALAPDLVLSNCLALKRELEPLVGCPIEVVENGVDTQRFDPSRARPRFREARGLGAQPVIGIAARPGHEKGMDLLAEVLRRVIERRPDAHLLVAGEGYRRAEFEARFRGRGLGERAIFLGHVDDIENFYASCDVVVLTSRSRSAEASSNAVLEAMAMERPIVATRVCGMPEVIRDGTEGWLADENDAATFAGHVARLLSDPALRTRMGHAGRARVLSMFAEKAAVARLAGLLTELADRA